MTSSLPSAHDPRVAVVITTYNHARYLGEALRSVLAQTHAAAEVLVVDDGSTDDPAAVVSTFAGVKLLRQPNQGLSAARNAGLQAVHSDKVVFLDADDRLLPNALAAGLACFAVHPDCAFVYGGYRVIDAQGARVTDNQHNPVSTQPYRDLLRGNMIAMHATVMYTRAKLLEAGGFDVGVQRCEDYDMYLRLARTERVASHPNTIAEYRQHDANMSSNPRDMVDWALRIHSRQASHVKVANGTADWREGHRNWRRYYAGVAVGAARRAWAVQRAPAAAARSLMQAVSIWPAEVLRALTQTALRRARRLRPAGRIAGRRPVGAVRLGDLDSVEPISDQFGYDRGMPIDRYYIEDFLRRHASDIRGRALEVGDDAYSRRFGASQVTHQDVLHVHTGNPSATIVGDLSQVDTLPADTFDCLVLTQTLHLIYDMRAAADAMHRSLKAGGVLLLTVPGITRIDRDEWGGQWYWSLTAAAAKRLFGDAFGPGQVQVESLGNVYAATTFLQGLALREVNTTKLESSDPCFPVIVAVRACKSASGGA
jgi:glycosyltransferase involved in cell wall biosynthesis